MILDKFRLDGKTAIVTGASRGIGFAMAEALAEVGANVMLVARSEDRLRENAEMLGSHSGKVIACPMDITDDDARQRLVNQAIDEFGSIDILINNAGVNHREPSEDFSIEQWDRIMDVNLRGVFLLTQKCARHMIKQGGGKVISTASLMSEVGGFTIAAYTASKGALKMLTKTLAIDWGEYNINVNAIAPGYVRTEMTEPLQKNEERNRFILDRVCLKRWGTVEDLKGITVFLASPASDYVTGQVFYIDGGYLAK